MPQAKGITPLSLAVPPSATLPANAERHPYSQRWQYAVEREDVLEIPALAANTRTFDGMGKPKDNDQDHHMDSTQTFDGMGKPKDNDSD